MEGAFLVLGIPQIVHLYKNVHGPGGPQWGYSAREWLLTSIMKPPVLPVTVSHFKKKRLCNSIIFPCNQIKALVHMDRQSDQYMIDKVTRTTSLSNSPIHMMPQSDPHFYGPITVLTIIIIPYKNYIGYQNSRGVFVKYPTVRVVIQQGVSEGVQMVNICVGKYCCLNKTYNPDLDGINVHFW